MQLFARQDVVGAIEFWQLCTAVAVFFIFPVSSQLKTVTIRVRDVEPFLWILSASAIASIVGPVATMVWMRQIPGMQSIEASALYVLALVVQLYQLWPCLAALSSRRGQHFVTTHLTSTKHYHAGFLALAYCTTTITLTLADRIHPGLLFYLLQNLYHTGWVFLKEEVQLCFGFWQGGRISLGDID